MAVYFPRGQQNFILIKKKFVDDTAVALKHLPYGIAFVTNQEITLAERRELTLASLPVIVDLFHLERLTTILDSPPMASVRKQFLAIEAEEQPVIALGGLGGSAPGAGGGGGGALGENARGGDGGPGGKTTIIGSLGLAPGAGGRGVGVSGDNAIGGQGGGGGERVIVHVDPEEMEALNRSGFQRIEHRVGMGGISGGPGEDTILNFVAADGTVLKSIIAIGGVPGLPAQLPVPSRLATEVDISAGLRLSTLIFAECAQLKNGLFNLLGAGWTHFEYPMTPFAASWPLVCIVETGSFETGTTIQLNAIVLDPTGLQVLDIPFFVGRCPGPVSRDVALLTLSFTGSKVGVWTIQIRSGLLVLGAQGIEIKARDAEESRFNEDA
ncbi:MAG: hypothetical protein ACKVQU_06635 [Burkholderiales bacterium]